MSRLLKVTGVMALVLIVAGGVFAQASTCPTGTRTVTQSMMTNSGCTLEVTMVTPCLVSEQEVESGQPVPMTCDVSLMCNPANIVFVVDVSASTEDPAPPFATPVGDQNNDGSSDTVLDAEIAAFLALLADIQQVEAQGVPIDVAVVVFATNAATADLSPMPGQQTFVSPSADDNMNGIPDVEEMVRSIDYVFSATGFPGGGFSQFTPSGGLDSLTNYDGALNEVKNAFQGNTTPNRENVVVFVSDGCPTPPPGGTTLFNCAGSPAPGPLPNGGFTPAPMAGPHLDLVNMGVTINAFGITVQQASFGQLCDAPGGPLFVLAAPTGGFCQEVADPSMLMQILPGGNTIDNIELKLTPPAMTNLPPIQVGNLVGPLPANTNYNITVDVNQHLQMNNMAIVGTWDVCCCATSNMVQVCAQNTFEVTACTLSVALLPAALPLMPGDMLWVDPYSTLLTVPVTAQNIPSFNIPNLPFAQGIRLYMQVIMYNAYDFPFNPLRVSNGMQVHLGGQSLPYGTGSGLILWLDQPTPLGGQIVPKFLVQ